jgi:hypothetical protein
MLGIVYKMRIRLHIVYGVLYLGSERSSPIIV